MGIEIERGRELRKKMTEAEKMLWGRLRRKQIHGRRFRRQHPIGPFITDFASVEARLIVELDGGQHAPREDEDAARTRWLVKRGYRVLRFWNNDVLTEIDAVLLVVSAAVQTAPLPNPPPASRGEGKEQMVVSQRLDRRIWT